MIPDFISVIINSREVSNEENQICNLKQELKLYIDMIKHYIFESVHENLKDHFCKEKEIYCELDN